MLTPLRDWLRDPETRPGEKALYAAASLTFFCLPLGTTPPTLTGGLAAAIWIFSGQAFEKRHIYRAGYWWPVYAMILLPWLGMLYTQDTTGLGMDYAEKTYYWAFGLAVAAIPFTRLCPSFLVRAFMAGLAVNVIAAIAQILLDLKDKNDWHLGLGPDYSTLSAYLIVGILMGLFFLCRERRVRFKIALAGLIGSYFLHLLILRSRASYVALFLLIPFIGYTFFKNRKLLKTVAVCVLLPLLMTLSPVVRNRIALTAEQVKFHLYSEDEAAWGKKYSVHQDRLYMWNGALKIIAQNPLIGVGTGGYQTALKALDSDPDAPEIVHPHNIFLHMAVSFGFVGLGFFLWFLAATMANGWRQRNTVQGHMILSVILVMVTTGLFNTQILDVGTAFLISLSVGMQASLPATADGAGIGESRSRGKQRGDA